MENNKADYKADQVIDVEWRTKETIWYAVHESHIKLKVIKTEHGTKIILRDERLVDG